MSRLGEGGETGDGADRSAAGGYFLPSEGYGEGTALGGRSPVGLATVKAFLEATAKVSTASATAAASARETSADDEAAAIRAIRESMLALAVSRGDSGSADADASVDQTSPLKSTSFRSGDAGDKGVRLAESRVEPGAPVVFRTREAREANPERLDLDRMGLRECCLLEGEHRLRLLNYQGNRIARVSRLESVKNLVFLDLTENALESLEGVQACPHLRVLLVGKNKLRRLGRALASLPKLDVLDARENEIDTVGADCAEVFGAATQSLRVLNLAGNVLRDAGNLRGLRNAHELDLRRNLISEIRDDSMPRSLRRCFLSGNPLASRDAIAPLASLKRLEALALDGAPWQTGFASRAAYRAAAAAVAPGLRTLDGEDVTDEERRAGGFSVSSSSSFPEPSSSGDETGAASNDDEKARVSPTRPPPTLETLARDGSGSRTPASASTTIRVPTPPEATSLAPLETYRLGVPRAGDSRRFETPLGVAFDAATRSLTVRGRVETEATLRDHPGASLARRVVFAEGVFSGDGSSASAGDPTRDGSLHRFSLVRLLRWARAACPRATALEFEDRGMGTLALVDAVARAGWRADPADPALFRKIVSETIKSPKRAPGLESLRVASSRGRPSVFFRSYAIHRFPTLQFVDDVAVTPEARARAAAAFAGLEDALEGGARREKKGERDAASAASASSAAADGTPAYVDGVVAHASEIAEKLRALDACWDDIVRSYVAEGLGEEG